MIKVEILRAVHWNGEHREPGAIIEVNDADANWLMGQSKAKIYNGPAPIENNRAIEVETSEQPKLTRRSWKKSSLS
jgi:hypothetical protein